MGTGQFLSHLMQNDCAEENAAKDREKTKNLKKCRSKDVTYHFLIDRTLQICTMYMLFLVRIFVILCKLRRYSEFDQPFATIQYVRCYSWKFAKIRKYVMDRS
jgi:hypothetical protein